MKISCTTVGPIATLTSIEPTKLAVNSTYATSQTLKQYVQIHRDLLCLLSETESGSYNYYTPEWNGIISLRILPPIVSIAAYATPLNFETVMFILLTCLVERC